MVKKKPERNRKDIYGHDSCSDFGVKVSGFFRLTPSRLVRNKWY